MHEEEEKYEEKRRKEKYEEKYEEKLGERKELRVGNERMRGSSKWLM